MQTSELTSSEYSQKKLSERIKEVKFNTGEKDVFDAYVHGYNMKLLTEFGTWMACKKLWGVQLFHSYIKPFTVDNLYDLIKVHNWINKKNLDKTSICHAIGKLHALGLVYRVTTTKGYKYYFENEVKTRGMNWFLNDNKYIINRPPVGGFLDDFLVR